MTARAVADDVRFCRENELLYHDGCSAGRCGWSDRTGQGLLGGGDGVSFVVEQAAEKKTLIVDLSVRLEKCDQVFNNGGEQQIKRHLGVLQIK